MEEKGRSWHGLVYKIHKILCVQSIFTAGNIGEFPQSKHSQVEYGEAHGKAMQYGNEFRSTGVKS